MSFRRPLTPEDQAAGRRAVAAMAHRGPDGDGEWIDAEAGLYLGHRRLAVIDLDDRASQPMEGHGLRISSNGEIYNYRELKTRLIDLGHAFRTESDTEVLLAGWREWGEALLEHVDGMFAFALQDGRDLVLAVDPFGEKPLFLQTTRDGCRFASEIAALAQMGSLRKELSEDDLNAFLALGYVPTPQTGFDGVERLEPGTILRIRDGEVLTRRRYWRVPRYEVHRGPVREPSEQDIDRVRDVLTRSVERRLVSDAPLSLFLSTGVDSTLMALLCRYELGVRPNTLTVAFKGALSGSVRIDETAGASRLARHIGSEHEERSIDAAELDYRVEDLISLFGLPFDNSGAFAVKLICSIARSSVTVGLTGLGGDELSFGYGKVLNLYRLRAWSRAPFAMQRASGWAAQRLSPLWPRLQTLGGRAALSRHQAYVAEKNFPALATLNRLPGFRAWTDKTFPAEIEAFAEVGNWDLAETMPNSLLFAQDHASMSESVELRTPFLSRELAEAMASFDARSLVNFGRKSLFRRLRQRYLDGFELDGRSHGFLFSTDSLLRRCGADAPRLERLPKSFVDDVWRRRFDGEGWTRLALRLALFERWSSGGERAPSTSAPWASESQALKRTSRSTVRQVS